MLQCSLDLPVEHPPIAALHNLIAAQQKRPYIGMARRGFASGRSAEGPLEGERAFSSMELTMTPSNYEIPSEMRDFAEKSVDQARKAFEGFMGAAQKAAGQADETATSVQSNAKAVGTKAITFAEENIRSAFDHAQRLVRAKDVQEVLSLQSEYLRTQMTTIQDQAKQLGSSIQGAAQSTVQATTNG